MRLEANNLAFRYEKGARDILCHASLALESGERIGISAPSGQGKTTLCKMLAGYTVPDAGTVLLDQKPLSEYHGSCAVQLIWQNPQEAVDPYLPIEKTLAEAGPLQEYLLTNLGIDRRWLGRYPGTLSGGELQRVCIARALGEATRFLLCDEVTAMLDLITQSQIWQFLCAEQARRNLGMLIVSHSPQLLGALCDKVLTWPPGA